MSTSDNNFNEIAGKPRAKYPPPFSLRLTFEERAKLEEAANGTPLGAYIRSQLFNGELKPVRRRGHRPVKDHEALARVLAALGASRLSSNLNQLAYAANTGALPSDEVTQKHLNAAYEEIREMRADLMKALGLESEGA